MSLAPGVRLGAYEAIALIGAGGMGESIIDAAAPESANPVLWVASTFNPSNGQFSPDGRWIAFSSTESGRVEIYVAPVSGTGGKVTVVMGKRSFI